MKKITLSLFFLLTMIMGSYGQVTVGEATTTSQFVPFNPYYGYTYAQSIYLASEINANGSITSIQWYYAGEGALTNSQGITLYLGQTTKTNFDSDIDYVAVADLTLVYTGGIVTGSTAGWKTITLTTPFPYDGISNLIVATDENLVNWDAFNDSFRATDVGANRSIYSFSDSVNTDPANPAAGSTNRAMIQFVPNIIFGGITQACSNPAAVAGTQATTIQATIGWTATVGQTEWEVLVLAQGTPAPTAATSGTLVSGAPTFLATGLTQNTGYSAYVRAKCSPTLFSGWSTPGNFRTLCNPFGDFFEDFTGTTPGTGVVPSCWTRTIVSANTSVNISVSAFGAASAPNVLTMDNSSDLTATILLVTPALNAIGANTHRMTFKARGAGFPLIVGTMTDPANATTFVALQTFTLGDTYLTYNVTLNTSTTANHIAFRHGHGGTFRTIFIDDITWEPIPTVIPACTSAVTVVTNEGCGNFPTTFSWAAVPGADGYNMSIGTAPNGQNLVVNNLNINSVLTYSFVGNPNTQYYYRVTPYNALGVATGCTEATFTTFGDGCYCVSNPTSIDAGGITNIALSGTSFPITPAVPFTVDSLYRNLTTEGAVDITQGINAVMSINYSTGYTYDTTIWIDFNDNFTFEPSELVFVGMSAQPNPSVLNSSFFTPLTAPLGQHRMRIVTADFLPTTPDPCFSGSWGMTFDILVNVLPAPTCLPPSASSVTNITATSAVLNWVSTGTLFNIEVDFAGFTQGNGTITTGLTGLTTTLNGLDPQANYAYYVQTDCGSGSLSPWTGPFLFRTACAPFGDFTENFTTEVSYTAPECWQTLINSATTGPSVSVAPWNDFISLNNSGNALAALYLITPSLTALPLNTHRIKFKANGPVGTNLVVGTMSDPGNESSFTAVQTIPMTTAFADYGVSFVNSTTNTYVAFKFVGTAFFQSLNLDDIIWETAPTCPDVFVVSFVSATPTTANITWAAGGAETAWQYAVGLATLADPSSLTPVNVLPAITSTTITGLLPATSYKVWIRAACGSEFGSWSPATTFITSCVPITTFPWTEGFENITVGANFPPCWSRENGQFDTATASTWNTPRTGTNYLRNNWSATNEFMWTPGFELTAGVSYDFSFYMQGDGFTGWTVDVFQNTVQSSTGATQLGGTTTASGTGTYVIQPYALVSNTIVPTTTGTYFFAVRVNQPSGAPWYIAFDDFRMEPTPTCIAPLMPTTTNVTATTATVNWVATTPAPVNGYDYFVSSTPVAPNATTVPTGTVGAGITSANLTALMSSTVYRIYVRSICGTNDFSSWSDANTFLTSCLPVTTFPWTEGFENITVGVNFPPCWSRQNGQFETAVAGTYNTPRTGTNYLRNYWSATNEFMWTPGFELTAGVSYDFSFYMQGDGFTGWTVDVFQNTVQSSTGANQLGATTTASGTGVYVIQPYALVSNTIVPTTTGTYFFAVRVNQPSGAPWYIAFDDFKMALTPTCSAPLAATATNVTATTATVNWVATTPAPVNGYNYFVSSTAVAPNATTVPTGTVGAGITTVNLTALMSSTVYRIYVRSICGTNDFSSWSDAGLFTTPCAAFAVPFTQGFSTSLPLCWATADAGTVATGPSGTAAGIWTVDGFLNVGTTGAFKANLYATDRIGWLITPEISTAVGTAYTLSFDYGVTVWNQTGQIAMGSDDFVKIAMSTDNGVTWTEIHNFNAASNVTNVSQEYNYELTATTTQVKFAVIASDGTVADIEDYDFFVDNFTFETNLSNDGYTRDSFTAYPNPVKDMLNLSFTQNISDVTIFNLLGQKVLSVNMNASKGQVDMSNLSSGTYLVKVNTENAVKTIKVIKQ